MTLDDSINTVFDILFQETLYGKLSEDEVELFRHLARLFYSKYKNIPVENIDLDDITYIDEGGFKAVYRIDSEQPMAVVAEAKLPDSDFESELKIQQFIHEKCPNFFPKPYKYIFLEDIGRKALIMDYVPFIRSNWFYEKHPDADKVKVAYEIGKAAGFVYAKTGMFTQEPHNGNVLLRKDGDNVAVMFVDAAHWVKGNDLELFDTYFNPEWARQECIDYQNYFEKGFDDGVSEAGFEINEDSDDRELISRTQ